MKHFILSVAIFMCCSELYAQTIASSFENSVPSGWTGSSFSNVKKRTGNRSYELTTTTNLTSTTIASAYNMVFYVLAKNGTASDLLVEISENGGAYSALFSLPDAGISETTWGLTSSIDLSPYSNFTLRFSISGSGTPAPSIYLEDLLINLAAPLPISLVEFKANRNRLSFVTATEINNDYFVIERSTDAKNFKEIGRVKGSGNSNTHKIYQFIDQDQLVGANYYRLKQVDFDGRFEYSSIVVSYLKKKSIKANIISQDNDNIKILILSDENTNAAVNILDMNGRLINTQNIVLDGDIENEFFVNQHLQKGMYVIQILTEGNQQTSKLFYAN